MSFPLFKTISKKCYCSLKLWGAEPSAGGSALDLGVPELRLDCLELTAMSESLLYPFTEIQREKDKISQFVKHVSGIQYA